MLEWPRWLGSAVLVGATLLLGTRTIWSIIAVTLAVLGSLAGVAMVRALRVVRSAAPPLLTAPLTASPGRD